MNRLPLKIAVVCYPSFGGSGVVATELGQALAGRGHNVHFICHNIPARLKDLSPSVHFHPVDVVTYPLFQFPPYTLALATRLAQTIEEVGIDLIHVHYAIPHLISAQLAREMTGKEGLKIITTLHGTDVQLVGLDPSYRDITKFSMERCCGLTAVSRFLAGETAREFDLKKPIEVIPNFVNLDRFKRSASRAEVDEFLSEGRKIICHISNFRPIKRVEDAIMVFDRVQKEIPSVLVMIGEGPERGAAQSLVDRLGLKEQVHFVSFVRDVERYLSVSDLFLFPSSMESFGLAALEAMACEVPVLAYDVGGLREVVGEDEGGFLFDPGDWEAMADGALRVLTDDALGREIGGRGRERAARLFSEDNVVTSYEDYYYRILKGDEPE